MAYHRHHGVDVRIVRIFNTFGPRMQVRRRPGHSELLPQAIRGEPITVYGDGSQTRSFCFVDDLVEGILAAPALRLRRAREHRQSERDDASWTWREKIIEITGSSSEIVYAAAPAGRPEGAPARHQPRATRARRLGAQGRRRGRSDPHAGLLRRCAGPGGGERPHDRSPAHPELLHHRPHRPRQEHARRSAARRHEVAHGPREARAVPRQDGPRARARHHDQGADRAHALQARDGEDVHPQPDRHARTRRLLLRGVAGARRPARAPSWWWTRPRASRPRRWPTPTWRWTPASRSFRSCNKIDLPCGRSRTGWRRRSRMSSGFRREDVLPVSAKEGTNVEELLERIVERVPPPRGDREPGLPGRWSSTPGSIPTSASSRWCASSTASCAAGMRVRFMATKQDREIGELDVIDPHPRQVESPRHGRGGHRDRRASRRWPTSRSATPSPRRRGRRRSRCRASAR